ncbi:MAG: phosphate ABC transporter permease subunit PstC, partial [Alphaproteobacteria bacterium]
MEVWVVVALVLAVAAVGQFRGRSRALQIAGPDVSKLHSLPGYHGAYVALWAALPALAAFVLWMIAEGPIVQSLVLSGLSPETQALPADRLSLMLSDIHNIASGDIASREPTAEVAAAAERFRSLSQLSTYAMIAVVLAISAFGLWRAQGRLALEFRARNRVERIVTGLMIAASAIAVFTTIGIVLSLLFEAWRFFLRVPLHEFLFGIEWSPQTAIRADQVGASGSFGAIPIFAGTLLITVIAMIVAVPLGLMSAIYMSEYATPRVRATAKPLLEVLAGVPTVVYGFFAALTIAPFFRGLGDAVGIDVASESALAAGVVMGVMIIPFVSSLSDDVMNAVPQALRDGSYALGATKSETIKQVVLPAALPGVVGAVLLAVSRAIGETMIVVMAAGLAANLTANPFEAVTTVTV